MTVSRCVPWPYDWPWYKQACFSTYADRCDMLVGPCACGAGHGEGEFELRPDGLYRYGRLVPSIPPEAAGVIPPGDACTVGDGLGGQWSAWCPRCGRKTMDVVRPGKAQCRFCG